MSGSGCIKKLLAPGKAGGRERPVWVELRTAYESSLENLEKLISYILVETMLCLASGDRECNLASYNEIAYNQYKRLGKLVKLSMNGNSFYRVRRLCGDTNAKGYVGYIYLSLLREALDRVLNKPLSMGELEVLGFKAASRRYEVCFKGRAVHGVAAQLDITITRKYVTVVTVRSKRTLKPLKLNLLIYLRRDKLEVLSHVFLDSRNGMSSLDLCREASRLLAKSEKVRGKVSFKARAPARAENEEFKY